jgi:hypothetical protein
MGVATPDAAAHILSLECSHCTALCCLRCDGWWLLGPHGQGSRCALGYILRGRYIGALPTPTTTTFYGPALLYGPPRVRICCLFSGPEMRKCRAIMCHSSILLIDQLRTIELASPVSVDAF